MIAGNEGGSVTQAGEHELIMIRNNLSDGACFLQDSFNDDPAKCAKEYDTFRE
jgi:hypothetical protein